MMMIGVFDKFVISEH